MAWRTSGARISDCCKGRSILRTDAVVRGPRNILCRSSQVWMCTVEGCRFSCNPSRSSGRDGATTHYLEVALPVTEEFPLGVPFALLLLAISCTVFRTVLPTRIFALSGASALIDCFTQAPSGVPEAPSTRMSGTLVPSAIVSWL